MIKRVRLENWKAFPSLDHVLLEGTTFIVAQNGVGKTSLLQALYFGLFGDRRLLGSGEGVEDAVRGTRDSVARVILDVDLGGVAWKIERQVPYGLGMRDSLPTAVVSTNEHTANDEAWKQAFSAASGVELDDLRLLSAIGEGDAVSSTSDGQYDLVRHLSDVLGVTRMRSAAKTLEQHAKVVSRTADAERLDKRDRPDNLAQREREALIQQQGAMERSLNEDRRRDQELSARFEIAQTRRRWEVTHRAELETAERTGRVLNEVLRRVEQILRDTGLINPSLPEDTAFDIRAASGQQALERLRLESRHRVERLGAVKALRASSRAAKSLLEKGEAICPTCLRPISVEEMSVALEGHRSSIAELEAEEDQLLAELDVMASSEGNLAAALADAARVRFTDPPPDSPSNDVDLPTLELELAEARSRLKSADERYRDLLANLRLHDSQIVAHAADEALSRKLRQSYREADLATLAAQTMETLADRICAEQISPLAHLLAKRWLELWPDRPTVSLDVETGRVFAEYQSMRLKLSDLSGGERTVANVLLRLLALQSASRSPILLLDEPLEHLDPRNRRMLAGVLVAAGRSSGFLRQILVTTYEESVTRRLSDVGSPSHVLYIRPGRDSV
jgi:DNA repair exonuclease SbcCD ATPase subunit